MSRAAEANSNHRPAPNLLEDDFAVDRSDTKRCSGITYITTHEGWLCLAVNFDLLLRRTVVWAMAAPMTQSLVGTALSMALLRQRQPASTLIHHSDRGLQYTGRAVQASPVDHKPAPRMSCCANCYDKAPIESFFGTL